MNKKLEQQTTNYMKEHKIARIWRKIVILPALMVVFCTVYLLILPAITMEKEVYCGKEEHLNHTIEEGCYEEVQKLNCEQTEEGHLHTENCYEQQQVLICDKEESEEHTHDESCYQIEKVLTCQQQEVHVHTDDCYVIEQKLICEKPIHKHTLECYSNPEADLETPQLWEKDLSSVELSGNWNEDIIAIAQSQLGYKESVLNYHVTEDGEKAGYTRYGAWYGNPYGKWDAMFVSFALNYAKVDKTLMPFNANCQEWIEELSNEKYGLYHFKDAYLPKTGDLIFFDLDEIVNDASRTADHVGIITELIKDSEGNLVKIKTIEGDQDNQVQSVIYKADDSSILGYGELPEQAKYTRTYQGNDFSVTAVFRDDANLKNAEMVVREIEADSAEYQNYYQKTLALLQEENGNQTENISFARYFDISFMVDGVQIEPSSAVKIQINYDEAVSVSQKTDVKTIHFDENNGPEFLETETEKTEESENAVDTFIFESENFSVLGTVLTVSYDEKTGTYYQRVDKIDDTSASYLIVSVEGNYALTVDTGAGTKVNLVPVKGNPGYYTINNVVDSMRWRFGRTINSESGTSTIRRGNSGNYLCLQDNLFNSTSVNLTLDYNSTQHTWTINNPATGLYLRYNNGIFSGSNSTSNTFRRDVIILKRLTNTTLSIPNDDYEQSGGGSGSGGTENRPNYDPYKPTSPSKSGINNDYNNQNDLTMNYYSDPATSQLESLFSGSTSEDGMIMTDKSVIYGKDDYDAFAVYQDDQFSVTLSALAQQYEISITSEEAIPIDVVLILDVSGSMTNEVGGQQRAATVVQAVNALIERIMLYHPENRVGIVTYSSGSPNPYFIPLSRYYVGAQNADPSYSLDNDKVQKYLTFSNNVIATNTNLRDANTKKSVSNSVAVDGGTYTQYGIALGAQMFNNVKEEDTTVTTEEGETVIRTPLMLLLSDGDPTHCTSNYTDVLNGPHYGNGNYPNATNNKGIQGYYTILSANYYKNSVSWHYNKQAKFYTIGMGINVEDYNDASNGSATGDHYKRAVLNPTAANITELTKYPAVKNYDTTALQLYKLLNNQFTVDYVTIDSSSSSSFGGRLGTTHRNVPVITNPYDNYSYADGAYFDKNYDPEALIEVFDQIVIENMDIKQYVNSFNETTSLKITDTIGEGMQIVGTPKLRYSGKNYTPSDVITDGNTTTYVYKEEVKATYYSDAENLNKITVRVTTVDGIQTIDWEIPGELVPEYVQAKTADWYYEELPIRLICQVGLTDASKEKVANLGYGKSIEFLTNVDSETNASASFEPSKLNPYFTSDSYQDQNKGKSENTTQTQDSYYVTKKTNTENTIQVNVSMGNNGKLVFSRGNTSSLKVIKEWEDENSPLRPEEVIVQLKQNGIPFLEPVTLNEANQWQYIYENLPVIDKDDQPFEYTVEEISLGGGYVAEVGEIEEISIEENGKTKKIWSITITNKLNDYQLPETGGIGTLPFEMIGALLIIISMLGFILRHKAERRNE